MDWQNSVVVMTDDGSFSDHTVASLSFVRCPASLLTTTSDNHTLTNSNYTDIVVCTFCQPGYQIDPHSSPSRCVSCQPETYSPSGSWCSACAPNTFQPNAGSAQCYTCDSRPDMPECAVGSWMTPAVIGGSLLTVIVAMLTVILTLRLQRQGRCLCSARQKERWQQQQRDAAWTKRSEDDSGRQEVDSTAVFSSVDSWSCETSFYTLHSVEDAAQPDSAWQQQQGDDVR